MLSTLVFREFRYKGNIEEYKKELINKINKNEDDLKSLKELARIYHAYSENDKAIKLYEKLLKDKKDHEIQGYLGYLYYENGNFDEAEESLKNALYLSEKNLSFYFY